MAARKFYLPDKADILTTIKPAAPSKKKGVAAAAAAKAAPAFKIIRTKILDPYETEFPTNVIKAMTVVAAAAAISDNFAGTARRAAKLSIAPGRVEPFDGTGDLLDTLPSHKAMKALHISTAASSNRVKEEKKNVGFDAWLYAASREADNNFHLILGGDPDSGDDPRFMNAEVSGLPPDDPPRAQFQDVRDSFASIVTTTPGIGYDFYDPPIPVSVEGSLFWDASHATGARPGPPSAKPKTVWEVHAITSIQAR